MKTAMKLVLFGAKKLKYLFYADFSKMADQELSDGQVLDGQAGSAYIVSKETIPVEIFGGVLKLPYVSVVYGSALRCGDLVPVTRGGALVLCNVHSFGSGSVAGFGGLHYTATSVDRNNSEMSVFYTPGYLRHLYAAQSLVNSLPVEGNLEADKANILITRPSGGFVVGDDLTLSYIFDEGTNTPLYPYISNGNSSIEVNKFAVLSLPDNGYTQWERDWTEVTDNLSAPASGTTFDVDDTDGFECEYIWTAESGTYVTVDLLYTDSNNKLQIWSPEGGTTYVQKTIGGVTTTLGTFLSDTDGNVSNILVVVAGGQLSVYHNGDMKVDSADVSDVPATSVVHHVLHTLTTNDLELTTNPYPALGPATSRVFYPQAGDTQGGHADLFVELESVTLPASGSIIYSMRYTDDNNRVYVEMDSSANLYLKQVSGGATTTLITTTMADGEDVRVRLLGADGELWNGATYSSTSAITVTTGTTCKMVDLGTGGSIKHSAVWPTDLVGNKLLPDLSGG